MKEEEKYIFNDLSAELEIDKKKALVYQNTEYLTKIGLWNDEIKNKIRAYNTQNNFTFRRYVQLKSNYLAYSFLYIIFKYRLKYPKGIDGDVLVIQDLCLSKGIEYVDVDWFLKDKRNPTTEFVRYLYENNGLDSYMMDDPVYLDKLLDIEDFKCDVSKVIDKDPNTKYKFLKKIDYKNWGEYKELLTDDFITTHLGCFRFSDLLFIRTKAQIYNLVGRAPYQERYKMYNKLELNLDVVKETRRELKSLVMSNIPSKITKFKRLSGISPLSVIYEVVDQIICFSPLIPLVADIIKEMDSMVKDIFVFYILKYIREKNSFVKDDCFAKWFVNLSSLIRIIYSNVISIPIVDFIKELLSNKRYSCVLLLESIDITEDILSGLSDVYKKVFVYEDYDLKLKMDVSDKYSILTKREFTLNPTLSNYKFMTPFEISSIRKNQVPYVINIIENINELEDNYFAIRNIALLVGTFIEDLKPYHEKLYDLFNKSSKDKEEDIRVICSSLVGKLTWHLKDNPNFNVKMKKEEITIKEEGEIVENVIKSKVVDQKTPQHPVEKPEKRIREKYLFDRFGKRIKDLKGYYRRGFPRDFYY